MEKYRRKSDGEIVEAAQTAWQVESSDGEFRYVMPMLGSNFRDDYEAVTEPLEDVADRLSNSVSQPITASLPAVTDADFNKFCFEGGAIVDAHQYVGQEARPSWVVPQYVWPPARMGEWMVTQGPWPGWWLPDKFPNHYEPIHPERKRLQSLCDEINAQPGMPALCPELLAARADGRVVDTNSGFYVKDREPSTGKPISPGRRVGTAQAAPRRRVYCLKANASYEEALQFAWDWYEVVEAIEDKLIDYDVFDPVEGPGTPEGEKRQYIKNITDAIDRLAARELEKPEAPTEATICAECEHQAITPAIPACVVGQIPPEARDWVTGGYNEDYGIPIDGKWRPYCNIVNTDGRCPNFKRKAEPC